MRSHLRVYGFWNYLCFVADDFMTWFFVGSLKFCADIFFQQKIQSLADFCFMTVLHVCCGIISLPEYCSLLHHKLLDSSWGSILVRLLDPELIFIHAVFYVNICNSHTSTWLHLKKKNVIDLQYSVAKNALIDSHLKFMYFMLPSLAWLVCGCFSWFVAHLDPLVSQRRPNVLVLPCKQQ